MINVPMILTQLVETLHNLCRGRGSNLGHPISLHLIVWALATRLPDKKKQLMINEHNKKECNAFTYCVNILYKLNWYGECINQ